MEKKDMKEESKARSQPEVNAMTVNVVSQMLRGIVNRILISTLFGGLLGAFVSVIFITGIRFVCQCDTATATSCTQEEEAKFNLIAIILATLGAVVGFVHGAHSALSKTYSEYFYPGNGL